jgi:hypothetical protein
MLSPTKASILFATCFALISCSFDGYLHGRFCPMIWERLMWIGALSMIEKLFTDKLVCQSPKVPKGGPVDTATPSHSASPTHASGSSQEKHSRKSQISSLTTLAEFSFPQAQLWRCEPCVFGFSEILTKVTLLEDWSSSRVLI